MAVGVKTQNVVLGPASSIKIGGWAADAGAGVSMTSVGYTKGSVTIETAFESYDIKPEQVMGAVAKPVVGVAHKVKFTVLEATLALWAKVQKLDAATYLNPGVEAAPNEKLTFGDPSTQYLQVEIIGPAVAGSGSTSGDRTITIWRAIVESVGALTMGKDAEQAYEVTLDCLYDDSIVTTPDVKGYYMMIVDTNAA